ncbi:MAG: serine/threonine protein kinase [Xanthomonadales bacterium]|nr:Serine/threonine-protein kinase PknD [Xanthomonadales bacterium]MCC6593979.1 serine/threonine protein kinase [Xanthomonadales bacterium]
MNPQRHQQANAIFLAACDLDPAAIPAFVRERCGEDAALEQQVYAMLAADAQDDGFLEGGTATAEPGVPDRIGGERGYRLLKRLGAGGMGEVWLAERADGEFRQRVAIKLLQAGQRLSREALRRFRAERQILAAFNHPHIARLLDGGTLPGGAPYLVMEYIDGEAIDAWCARHALAARARVALFLKVCDAVQAAHQALIVHRDLKPSNILVGVDGQPKLLDFGIAKVLNAELFAHSLVQTRTGVAPMTLAYASPEQVRGEAVGTASDVYSLAVVLYELLTGVLPYRTPTADPVSMARAVCEQPPDAPSRQAASARSDRGAAGMHVELRGDLDAILLKALRKEPAERYRSVEQLAGDLQRWLSGLPVQARRGSRAYAARKFIGRHRWAVIAATLALGATFAFIVALQAQLRRVEVERDKAEAMTGFMVSVFDRTDPETDSAIAALDPATITMRQVIDENAPRVERELGAQPEAQARLLAVIARIYSGLDLQAQSLHYGELALRRLEETGQVPSAASVDARLYLMTPLYYAGRLDEAMAQGQQAVAEARSLEPDGGFHTARALHSRATMHRLQGDLDRDEADAIAAVDMMKRVRPGSAYVSVAMKEVAQVASLRGDHARCEAVSREAMDGWPARLGRAHVYFVSILQLHAGCLHALGQHAAAEAEVREALAVFERTRGAHSPSAARARLQLGRMLNQRGAWAQAEAPLRAALATFEAALGAGHLDTAATTVALAEARCGQGATDEALPMFERAIAALQSQATTLAAARLRLGICLAASDPVRAASELDAAIAWLDAHAPMHPDRVRAEEIRKSL